MNSPEKCKLVSNAAGRALCVRCLEEPLSAPYKLEHLYVCKRCTGEIGVHAARALSLAWWGRFDREAQR